jgi:hypothetical protein
VRPPARRDPAARHDHPRRLNPAVAPATRPCSTDQPVVAQSRDGRRPLVRRPSREATRGNGASAAVRQCSYRLRAAASRESDRESRSP